MITVYQATDIGPRRDLNEDIVARLDDGTCIVADGMGGHAAGEVASALLVETVKVKLKDAGRIDEDALRRAVMLGNFAILRSIEENPARRGMGTTATMFHISDGEAVWAHVGDSRLYLLRDGDLRQITRDHSLVEDLVENGSITREEARVHPKRNVITRAVGMGDDLVVDTGRFYVFSGDILLLCTDGLNTFVPDEKIRELLIAPGRDDQATVLVRCALDAGSRDNISALVAVVG